MSEHSFTVEGSAFPGAPRETPGNILFPGLRLCGPQSPLLNGAARVGQSLRTLGLRGTVTEIRDLLTFHLRARSHTAPRGIRPGGVAPGACSWLDGSAEWTVAGLMVPGRELAAFLAETRFPRFYYQGARRVWYALWHLVGLTLCDLTAASVVVDVGAGMGIWGRTARRRFGCTVWDVDCRYPPGLHGRRIGAAATAIPLPASSVSHVVSFCAFNCFEGTTDTEFLREAFRLLKPGGKLVIVPLCICDAHLNLYDPSLCTGDTAFDPGAHRTAWDGWGNRFGRWYDQEAFRQRLVLPVPACQRTIVRVDHDIDLAGMARTYYAIRFVKPGDSPAPAEQSTGSSRPYHVAWRLSRPTGGRAK